MVNYFLSMVLFDHGASRLLVSPTFYAQFVIPRSPLSPMSSIEVVVGSYVLVWEKYYGYLTVISVHTFPLTLI